MKRPAGVQTIEMRAEDLGKVPLCCYKDPQKEGYQRKGKWIQERMSEGLKVKMLNTPDDGLVGYIEYIPGEHAWRAVNAAGYMFIHCIFIEKRKYKGKGYGSLLVADCINDAKKAKMNGVAVVTRKGTWMVGKELFLRNGFEEVDEAPSDFSLLAKRFRKSAPTPSFKGGWDKKLKKFGKGLVIITSGQCPYGVKTAGDIIQTARDRYGIEPTIVEYRTCKQAQSTPWPSATSGLVYDGKLVADHPVGSRRFQNIMEKELGITTKKGR